MALTVVNGARLLFLDDLLAARLDGSSLCLFVAAHTVAVGDTAATYTAIEASWPGYARITLSGWGATFINANGNAQTDHPQQSFTSTGTSSQSNYGYFVLDATGNLLYAEADVASFAMNAVGRVYLVTPHFYLGALGTPFLRPRPVQRPAAKQPQRGRA